MFQQWPGIKQNCVQQYFSGAILASLHIKHDGAVDTNAVLAETRLHEFMMFNF